MHQEFQQNNGIVCAQFAVGVTVGIGGCLIGKLDSTGSGFVQEYGVGDVYSAILIGVAVEDVGVGCN